jgi:dTDP-4-amino-4,6-dideoxygalactose transaminase
MWLIPRRWAQEYPGEARDIDAWSAQNPAAGQGFVGDWEKAVADFTRTPAAVAVGSGRRGMALIFERLGIGAGDEVIVPAYTLGDLLPLIQAFGAIPIPADIDPDTWNLSPASVAGRISARTRAILALHLFGNPCDIASLVELAAAHGIPLIEDCAHALGATVQGQPVGTFGHAGFFSFEMTKPVNTFGGGMVVSQDGSLLDFVRDQTVNDTYDSAPALHKVKATRTEKRFFKTGLSFPFLYALATPSLRPLMNRLYRASFHAPPKNLRYLPFQARLGLEKLRTLPERLRVRNERAALFRSLLAPHLRTQCVEDGNVSTCYFFVVQLPCAAGPVRQRLLLRGIDAGIEGEIADDCAALLGYDDCPNVRRLYAQALALPFWDGISPKTLERVARAVNRVCGS